LIKALSCLDVFLVLFNSNNFKKLKLNFKKEELETMDEEKITGFIKKNGQCRSITWVWH